MTLLELALASRLFKRARCSGARLVTKAAWDARPLAWAAPRTPDERHSRSGMQWQHVCTRQPALCRSSRSSRACCEVVNVTLTPSREVVYVTLTFLTSLAHRPWSRTPARRPRRWPCSARTPSVCHSGLEPRTSRPYTGLLLTRLSLALDRLRRPRAAHPARRERHAQGRARAAARRAAAAHARRAPHHRRHRRPRSTRRWAARRDGDVPATTGCAGLRRSLIRWRRLGGMALAREPRRARAACAASR